MKLRATDQISISAVKADSLRPGEEFDVSDAYGRELLEKHSSRVERVEREAAEKAEAAPKNKAETPTPNKSDQRKQDRKAG